MTDLIWRSPLGLRINAQATADASMTEDWVKVGGSQLVPRDGAYDLRITAELWETHFFDLVSLAVVDHPAGTEVFVDERFAMPAPALDADRHRPAAAVRPRAPTTPDATSRRSCATRDDRHLDFAGRGRYQGITRQHAIELVVPDDGAAAGAAVPRRAGLGASDRQLDQRRDRARARTRRRAASRSRSRTPHGRFRTVHANLGFPVGQGQDGPDRPATACCPRQVRAACG